MLVPGSSEAGLRELEISELDVGVELPLQSRDVGDVCALCKIALRSSGWAERLVEVENVGGEGERPDMNPGSRDKDLRSTASTSMLLACKAASVNQLSGNG